MNVAISRGICGKNWVPTHKLTAIFGEPRVVHCWVVMVTGEGFAYTRYEWMNGLAPSFYAIGEGKWAYSNPEVEAIQIIKVTFERLKNHITPPLVHVHPPFAPLHGHDFAHRTSS